ncbi:MAG: hypothetical protein B7C24_08230 [Bacteroidetes bacterium 4572_77]|nr:MAG: hypothetical protein B7C24_08230 [Bacteroidetes bacterium 4572_77]
MKNNNEITSPNMKYITIILGYLIVFPFFGFSQSEDLKTNEEVMVIAPFNPTIRKAKRIHFLPQSDSNKAAKLEIDYITDPKIFPTNIPMEDLTAAKFVEDKTPNYSQNFVKLGYGLYSTPYAELFFNSKLSNESQVGVYAKYLATHGDIKEVAYSGNNNSKVKVWTKRIQKKFTTKLNVHYQRNEMQFYGFKPEDYPADLLKDTDNFKEDMKQIYNKVGVDVDLKGTYKKRYYNWDAQLNYNYYWDHFSSEEQLIDLKGYYESPVKIIKVEKQYFGANIKTQTYYTNQNFKGLFPAIDSSQGLFHGLYEFTPYYRMEHNNFKLKIAYKMQIGADSSDAYFYSVPEIHMNVSLLDDALSIYALLDGGLQNNSLQSLSQENPFMSPVVPIKYSKSKYRIRAGLKGHYTSSFDFNIYGEMADFENMPLYITDTNARFDNTFKVIYDGGRRYATAMELMYNKGDWNVNLNAQYNIYQMDTVAQAWQKPAFTSKLKISYHLLENLKLSALLIGQSKMYNYYKGEQTVNPWFDMSFKANYHWKRTLAFYLTVSNVLSNNYEIWYGYPVQSIGIMGGVSLAL